MCERLVSPRGWGAGGPLPADQPSECNRFKQATARKASARATAAEAHGHHPYPVHGAEVHGLGKVKALVEAAVVGSRERDHKLPGTLVSPVNLRRQTNGRFSVTFARKATWTSTSEALRGGGFPLRKREPERNRTRCYGEARTECPNHRAVRGLKRKHGYTQVRTHPPNAAVAKNHLDH